ncbi:MAG TPA: hypothetical protein PLY93_14490, partial [Turneriella sp.]|nr:hypothetical protein [Turneriella sp.]
MTKKNNTFFDLLTQVSLPAQNQTLLNLEKFWFQDGISNTFAEELKRETIPLKLSVSKAEIAAVQKCAVQAGLAAQHAHETLEVLLDVCGRQPTKIIFSLKVFEHITPRIHIEENTLSLGNDALLEDALAAATLLARFPQLVYTAPPTIETENALKLPQAFR